VHQLVPDIPDLYEPFYEEVVVHIPFELGPVLLRPHQMNVVTESEIGYFMNPSTLSVPHSSQQFIEDVDLTSAPAEPVLCFLDEDERTRYVAELAR
jgi:hypothetical protein